MADTTQDIPTTERFFCAHADRCNDDMSTPLITYDDGGDWIVGHICIDCGSTAKIYKHALATAIAALPRSVTLIGRRWFDRRNGNTYFSGVALVDGIERATIAFEYGYGDQYAYALYLAIETAGWIPERYRTRSGLRIVPRYWINKTSGATYYATVSDVARKRDL